MRIVIVGGAKAGRKRDEDVYKRQVSLISADGDQSSFLPLPAGARRAKLPGISWLNNVSTSPNGSQRIKLMTFSSIEVM